MDNGFIDIHCHILPGLDEGASHIEESKNMLQIAKNDGISGIVATPHIMSGVYNNTKEIIGNAISEFKKKANTISVYIGAEIRICRDLAQKISNDEFPLINDKRYLLLELPTFIIPPLSVLENMIKSLSMNNIIAIFAHPERNRILFNNLSIMERLSKCGALFQVTAMSITNQLDRKIQKTTLKMIQKNYVQVVASDAHDDKKRPPILSRAYKKIAKEFGEQKAEQLFIENPLKIIQGVTIE